jgi:cytochrome c peroxidase
MEGTVPFPAVDRKHSLLAALLLAFLAPVSAAQDVIGEFPKLQVPAENPLTPEKIRLGQALFYEEQLSSDDTMACATCHRLEAGGGDPRMGGRAPGADGLLNTPDDEFGSFGVVLRDAEGKPKAHPVFGMERQVTARNPQSVIAAAFFNVQFADTRALPTFRDLASEIVLNEYASLESQAVGPLMSSTEMAQEERTWDQLTTKLAAVRPLALANDLPPTLAEFIGAEQTYGPLFQKAFGGSEITRERIAMAIASYERTLIPDQTPFDLGTMSERQQLGFKLFKKHGACEICHTSSNGLFSDGARRNITLAHHERPVKTPTLRNAGLRARFMSSGQFTTLDQVLRHYENLDFIHFESAEERVALLDFVGNALTDPRVEKGEPPFDRPKLRSEVEPKAPPVGSTADSDAASKVADPGTRMSDDRD